MTNAHSSSSAGRATLGHELCVPEVGDYHALPQEGEGRALVRTARRACDLVSNVCRHRQALMLRGRGQTREHIVCPIHRWTYDLHGQLVGAPHFQTDPCLNLNDYPLQPGTGCCSKTAAAMCAPRWPALGATRRARLQRPRARPGGTARVRLQLEDLHRGLPGGLPRRALPSRAGRFRQLRRSALGVRRAPLGADGGPAERRCRGPGRPPTAAGTRRC